MVSRLTPRMLEGEVLKEIYADILAKDWRPLYKQRNMSTVRHFYKKHDILLSDHASARFTGQYDPYDYCFHGLGMLAHETESEQIMTPTQYERLWASDFEDLCYDFEENMDAAETEEEKAALTKAFVFNIKIIYETIMI